MSLFAKKKLSAAEILAAIGELPDEERTALLSQINAPTETAEETTEEETATETTEETPGAEEAAEQTETDAPETVEPEQTDEEIAEETTEETAEPEAPPEATESADPETPPEQDNTPDGNVEATIAALGARIETLESRLQEVCDLAEQFRNANADIEKKFGLSQQPSTSHSVNDGKSYAEMRANALSQ